MSEQTQTDQRSEIVLFFRYILHGGHQWRATIDELSIRMLKKLSPDFLQMTDKNTESAYRSTIEFEIWKYLQNDFKLIDNIYSLKQNLEKKKKDPRNEYEIVRLYSEFEDKCDQLYNEETENIGKSLSEVFQRINSCFEKNIKAIPNQTLSDIDRKIVLTEVEPLINPDGFIAKSWELSKLSIEGCSQPQSKIGADARAISESPQYVRYKSVRMETPNLQKPDFPFFFCIDKADKKIDACISKTGAIRVNQASSITSVFYIFERIHEALYPESGFISDFLD